MYRTSILPCPQTLGLVYCQSLSVRALPGQESEDSKVKTVGVVGLGDMGLGIAKNVLAAGFPLVGFDLREERLTAVESAGGRRADELCGAGKGL